MTSERATLFGDVPRRRVWRVWAFDVNDSQGYETGASLHAEPFAVADGKMYWKAFVSEPRPDDD